MRQDILEHDATFMARIIQQQLIKRIVDINFGERPADEYPVFEIDASPPVDLQAMVEVDKALVNELGMELKKSEAYARYQREEPTEEDEVLEGKPTPTVVSMPGGFGGPPNATQTDDTREPAESESEEPEEGEFADSVKLSKAERQIHNEAFTVEAAGQGPIAREMDRLSRLFAEPVQGK